MALTGKQEMFCREYLIDLNATRAAVRAGYSEKTANRIAAKLLSKVDIQNRISELKSQRNEQVDVDAAYVLRRLVEIDQMDVLDILKDDGGIKAISEWPKVWRTTLSGFDINTSVTNFDETTIENILKKIKWPDKVKNLELLGKHVTVQAFKEKIETEDITPVSNRDARQSRIKELLNRGGRNNKS
jgi:phage terminase small subunit